MPSKKPPTPPNPRHTNRPLAQPTIATSEHPLTDALMKRITRIIDNSDGKLTRAMLADAIGKRYQDAVEYLRGFRSRPNSEITLRLLRWADKHDPKTAKK